MRDTPTLARLHSLYLFAFSTGWRPCELLAVGPEQLDLDRGLAWLERHLVRVTEDGAGRWEFKPGSKIGKRYAVPLTEKLCQSLAARLEIVSFEASSAASWTDWDLLWPALDGRPTWVQALRDHLERACAVAELPRLTPHHLFRRGASTLLKAEGVDAKTRAAMLGHSRVATTEDVYTDVLPDDLRAAAETMGRLLGET